MTDPPKLSQSVRRSIDELAGDRLSGASEILERAVALLDAALNAGDRVVPLAQAICRAQPSMANVWNAALAAVSAIEEPTRFRRFTARLERADEAIARCATEHFHLGTDSSGLRIVTLSFSRTVLRLLTALSRSRRLQAACAEGRPAYEGRRMAADLASAGIPVSFYTDAAIAQALPGADAVIFGVDAVTAAAVVNKSGTRQLAAAAVHGGVPVYAVASRDKFLSPAVAAQLQMRGGEGAEVWPEPAHGVTVRNTYFEATPLDLLTSVITDDGLIGADLVPQVCESARDEKWLSTLLNS